MALNKSNLMIRDYEDIRRILRDIYIYGCYTKEDFVRKGFGSRKIDKEQQRLHAYLPENFIRRRRENKKLIQYCRYDITDDPRRYLAETYRNKSFTMLDILSYFYVLQILGDGKERTLSEILAKIPCANKEVIFTRDNLRIKLGELVSSGFIKVEKKGKNVRYSLSDDIWEEFDDEELAEIYNCLEFLKNTSPLQMPYCFLQRRLKLYRKFNRKKETSRKSPFQFKHTHSFNCLDDDIMLACLKVIRQQSVVAVYGENAVDKTIGLPIKTVHDSVSGRQYLIYYNIELETVSAVRLDRAAAVEAVRGFSEEEKQIVREKKNYDEDCWCTSLDHNELQEVVIEFRFDEEKEPFIMRRLLREGHGGRIEKKDTGIFEYRISVLDPDEMIPWIRSFGERARVIRSGSFNTGEKIARGWEKAVAKYEALS